MFSRRPLRGGSSPPGSSLPVPFDVLVLLCTIFVTFSLQFFASTAWLPELLRLTPAVWQRGWVWQLATYPLVGTGAPGIWFLLELLILFWFARDVHGRLGSRGFRRLLAWATIVASVVAVLVQLAGQIVPGASGPLPFALLQGQRLILVVVIAAFATLFGNATIYLFFVLPVQAKWFLWLEVLFAFMGFLGTRDLAGFVGICAAIAVTYNLLTRGALRRGMREIWLRMEHKRIQRKMARMRRRSGIRLVDDDERGEAGRKSDDPWVH